MNQYIEHIEMIECKDRKHTCIYCLEKRVLAEEKHEKISDITYQ